MTEWSTKKFQAMESQIEWEAALDKFIDEAAVWLTDEDKICDTLGEIEDMLRKKHHDYGEENLKGFGEFGILVRVSDKVARLKNLIDKEAQVEDEDRAATWRDLAGYAIQALIMMEMEKRSEKVNYYETRKNRLIRGHCPDCGEGVLIRENFFDDRLHCSAGCGFETDNLYNMREDYETVGDLIEYLAHQPAMRVQV